MKTALKNRQSLARPDLRKTKKLAQLLLTRANRLNPEEACSSLTLVLTDDEGISRVNRACFNRSASTDVISAGYEPVPGDPAGRCAEVFVNVERALLEGGSRARWSPSLELALYIAHGCDHLAGATDADPAGRARMRRRELRWLRRDELRSLAVDLFLVAPESAR